jgi:polysaccharide export outer membrane protein
MDFPMRGACAAISRLLAAPTLPGCMRTTSVAYREPSVAVEIDSYRPFFILGEVAAPGQYPYVPNMSVESAVAIAGGFTPRARGDRITPTHTDGAGLSRMVVPLGTAPASGDTVQVGERWF